MVTNDEFLQTIFGVDAPWVHVTDFPYSPDNIPKDKHLIAWKGDYYSRYTVQVNTNQYFCISNFYCDEQQQARRRKVLFRHTPCIVLDDVKEKLSMTEVDKLPSPSWVLESSQGSEQWGYILNTPCTERGKVENLLDGLVANGLAPDGRDPGMKGVTRYVRLPEGINNKTSKLVNGLPFKCQITLWQPFNRVTIEQLASPFMVDLNRPRRESRVDGAADVSDHPLINIPDVIQIKEVRSDGRFDIQCPWVHNHTGQDDSGSAVFTNADNTIGFKCHHGSCQERTGKDLLRFIENKQPGFNITLKNWQIAKEFDTVTEPSFITPVAPIPAELPNFITPVAPIPIESMQDLCDALRREHPTSEKAKHIASRILKFAEDIPKIDQIELHATVCDIMNWNKGDFKNIIKDLRGQWYTEKINDADFYDDVVFVKELNQFYDYKSRIFFSTEAFQNSFSHEDAEARKIALQDGRVRKVDRLDYAPKQLQVFTEGNTVFANTWTDHSQVYGYKGDISRWYDHFDALGWGKHRKHIIQWLAFTLRHPDKKINHMLLLGSSEGCGKDFLLYPLTRAMGDNYTVIAGEELLRDFDDHLLSTKYLHINEAELGDRREALAVSNRLKPLAAAPPDTLRVNQKGIKPIKIRNILNVTMTTNSLMPLRLNGPSRRFLAVWSDLNPRDDHDNMLPEWKSYWDDRWTWMKQEGWKHIAWHLMHEVDLSDFNPNEAPPVTEFLRDIKEASKSPMQQTIESFIKKKLGSFQCDVITSSDMSDTLRAGGAFASADMYTDSRYFTPIKVGMVMKEISTVMQVRGYNNGTAVRLWVIRNRKKYESITPTELYRTYEKQMSQVKPLIPELRLVK